MTTLFSVKNPGWDLSKSRYDETNEFLLMTNPGPVLVILASYLLFVLKVGPQFMRKREPYQFTNVLVAYNAVQVIISAYLVQKYFRSLLDSGFVPEKCYMHDDNLRKEILYDIWLYFAAKVTELLDTIFFVLRKKNNQVTFLHLYHHSVMMIGTWAVLKYWPSHTLIFIGFLNSLVHVFMYTYYGLAALGPNMTKYLTWKKYMTTFQLVQFISIIIQYTLTLKVSECPPSKGIAFFISGNTAFFLFLFCNFYRKSYRRREVKQNKVNGVNECCKKVN